MVSVCLQAGLGNRMFCYAFGLGLKSKGLNVYIDENSFVPRNSMTFEDVKLNDIFPNITFLPTPTGAFPYSLVKGKRGKLLRIIDRIIRNRKYIIESEFNYIPDIEKYATNNCCYVGLWQTSKYFHHCETEVKKQFVFLPFDEKKNIEIANKMASENSVSIHIRKGADYKDSLWENTCTKKYYQDAINYILEHIQSPVFYIFTDNPGWVKDNIVDIDYIMVDWNPTKGPRNFRDMQLMGCSKHNIIANSSYSWWAAYLNPNPSKIVVAPSLWFSPRAIYYRNNKIVPDEWIKL